jgi:hypothetical protein
MLIIQIACSVNDVETVCSLIIQSAPQCHCHIDSQTVLYNYSPVWTIDAINWQALYQGMGPRETRRLGAIAKLRKATVSLSCLSVRPNGATGLRQDGLFWNLIFDFLSKILRENLHLIRIWQDLKGTLHEYLRTFMTVYRGTRLRMRNISGKKVVKKMKDTFFVQ